MDQIKVSRVCDCFRRGHHDNVGRVAGSDGWYQILRFGESANGPY